ncbi:hypothetical protein K402DRAFT_388008 [Aulographum hederae CBS 113979]|uniref:Ig-like domain-containing protein n=1 Tax=Aulographum hederae CBS 113979 TaxID=1176131 RepID=A0A6G1HGQ0_9PEZI|nr:hypothetical protein K402DRAFT_388008 [Aulographum hederae CBS 113979]
MFKTIPYILVLFVLALRSVADRYVVVPLIFAEGDLAPDVSASEIYSSPSSSAYVLACAASNTPFYCQVGGGGATVTVGPSTYNYLWRRPYDITGEDASKTVIQSYDCKASNAVPTSCHVNNGLGYVPPQASGLPLTAETSGVASIFQMVSITVTATATAKPSGPASADAPSESTGAGAPSITPNALGGTWTGVTVSGMVVISVIFGLVWL